MTVTTVLVLIGMGFFQPSKADQTDNRTPKTYEFKVMLKNSQFTSRNSGIKDFKKAIIQKLKVIFNKDENEKSRIVTYLDTKNCHLKNNNFILRKRFTLKNNVPDRLKVTLKFRGTDIDIVSKKTFEAKPSSNLTQSKFEADIVKDSSLPSMIQYKFSHSANIELGKFKNISQLMSLYPVLGELETDGDPKNIKLKPVNKFAAFETLVELGTVTVAEQECDASFSFWYKTREKSYPIVAEFSYVCEKNTDEAHQLYRTILGLDDWVRVKAKTKTAIAYGESCGK